MHTMLTPQANLLRPSESADPWGRYYTSDWVSEHLIGSIRTRKPKLVVELGAGQGALTMAAAEKWQHAQFVTVDMDREASRQLWPLAQRPQSVHRHYIHDALDVDLPNYLSLALGSVDVAICNPPYIRPRWRARFGCILEDAGLSGALRSIHDAGADLLFVAQNLRLLRRKGKLGLILPDGLITAEKFAGVRKVLLSQHLIEQVVQLPRNVFSNTEAQTYLVVLAKRSGETGAVALRKFGVDGCVSDPVFISADQARRRLDYDFYLAAAKSAFVPNSATVLRIRDLVQEVQRGSVSTQEIGQTVVPVFHLSDFGATGEPVPRRFHLARCKIACLPRRLRIAFPGDVLVGRIGRNLQDKVALVVYGPCVVSDCVFILKVKSNFGSRLLGFLSSPVGRRALSATAHGVGARYLSVMDVLDIQVSP